jgi:hypothetical protein
MTIEVLIPIHNPTEVFSKTIDSLAAQMDKNFSVLISDNFSTKGAEHIESAIQKLSAAGIPARKIQPPSELGRVEHWNWLHYQSQADWLKPLFAGDWLESIYVTRLRETISANPSCRYVFSNGYTHRPGEEPSTGENPWTGRFHTAKEMQDVVLRYGMQFGPPSAAAYDRTAFLALGGYPETLPIVADSFLFCTFAARFGTAGMAERLVHFNIHTARFSTTLPSRQRDSFREMMIYFFLLVYHAWTEDEHIPRTGFLRMLARETKNYMIRN